MSSKILTSCSVILIIIKHFSVCLLRQCRSKTIKGTQPPHTPPPSTPPPPIPTEFSRWTHMVLQICAQVCFQHYLIKDTHLANFNAKIIGQGGLFQSLRAGEACSRPTHLCRSSIFLGVQFQKIGNLGCAAKFSFSKNHRDLNN